MTSASLIEPRHTRRITAHGRLWVFLLPALLVFGAFAVVPLIGVGVLSFTSWDGIGAIHFAGLDSWRTTLSNPRTFSSLRITVIVMVLSWLVQMPMAVLIGVFLAGRHRYRAFLAVLYFVPLVLSATAVAITWKALLDPNFGLGSGLGLPLLSQDWLGEPVLAMGVVIFVISWQWIAFYALIIQGAVRQIPVSLYEAAEVDGAGRVRQFFSITLPQLRHTIITCTTLIVVGSLTFFDLIFVLTQGGPNDATRVLALDMYITGFRGNEMGPASAIAVILVLLGLGIAQILRWIDARNAGSDLEGA